MLGEKSQLKKDKYCIISCICEIRIDLTSEQTKENKPSDSDIKMVVTREKGVGAGGSGTGSIKCLV